MDIQLLEQYCNNNDYVFRQTAKRIRVSSSGRNWIFGSANNIVMDNSTNKLFSPRNSGMRRWMPDNARQKRDQRKRRNSICNENGKCERSTRTQLEVTKFSDQVFTKIYKYMESSNIDKIGAIFTDGQIKRTCGGAKKVHGR